MNADSKSLRCKQAEDDEQPGAASSRSGHGRADTEDKWVWNHAGGSRGDRMKGDPGHRRAGTTGSAKGADTRKDALHIKDPAC